MDEGLAPCCRGWSVPCSACIFLHHLGLCVGCRCGGIRFCNVHVNNASCTLFPFIWKALLLRNGLTSGRVGWRDLFLSLYYCQDKRKSPSTYVSVCPCLTSSFLRSDIERAVLGKPWRNAEEKVYEACFMGLLGEQMLEGKIQTMLCWRYNVLGTYCN